MFVCLFFCVQDRVFKNSFGACPGTTALVDQAGLKLTEICLFLPPNAGIKGVCHHHPIGAGGFYVSRNCDRFDEEFYGVVVEAALI